MNNNIFDVYEISITVKLLKDIDYTDVHIEIADFIDKYLFLKNKWKKVHKRNEFKNYVFNSFYPQKIRGIYKKDELYIIKLRTVNYYFNDYISKMNNFKSDSMASMIVKSKKLERKPIAKMYSITPVIVKFSDKKYWRNKLDDNTWHNIISEDEYIEQIKLNLIKKYKLLTNKDENKNIDLIMKLSKSLTNYIKVFDSFEFINKKPISFKYKNIKLLGDKLELLNISDDEESQEIAYMALGTGIGEMNARGAGFVNVIYSNDKK